MTRAGSKYPKHLKHYKPNWRAFKAAKRRELLAVVRAWDLYRMGSAYCPADSAVTREAITRALDVVRDSQRADRWGR